jgi:carbamoyl-phosphate synthase small subunit
LQPALSPRSMPQAFLTLADGRVFQGYSIGASGTQTGEVVFNTYMTGYQEIITDPSYYRQIVTLTVPHVGNVAVNSEDKESEKLFISGLVIRDLSPMASNWRAEQTLSDYLKQHHILGIAGIDTRELTRHLREHGAQNGCLVAADDHRPLPLTVEEAIKHAQNMPSIAGCDLAKEVTCSTPFSWTEGTWSLASGYRQVQNNNLHVVAYDFGVKHTILRLLAERGCRLTIVPAQTSAEEVFALHPDGVFLSNGPGDPGPCSYAIQAIQRFIEKKIPLFGICLGHQLLGLACGAQSLKMKFGHHGGNHPVLDLKTKRVFITSQNHGFALDRDSLPSHLEPTHISLFDQSLQGIQHRSAPAFGFQGHPEASPGPHDIDHLFDHFIDLIRMHRIPHGQAI